RVALARALALEARIVIIDDFDSGVDNVRLALLCELIKDVQAQNAATFLVTTHDMAAARQPAGYPAVVHTRRVAPRRAAARRGGGCRWGRSRGRPVDRRRALGPDPTQLDVSASRSRRSSLSSSRIRAASSKRRSSAAASISSSSSTISFSS